MSFLDLTVLGRHFTIHAKTVSHMIWKVKGANNINHSMLFRCFSLRKYMNLFPLSKVSGNMKMM